MGLRSRQRAWLIGASSGMGLEVGRLLAKRGWEVILSARSKENLEQAANAIGATALILDITNRKAVATAAKSLFAARPPQLVLLNAGDYRPMPLEAFDVKLFEQLNHVNYLGAVYVLGAILPLMRNSGGGQILLNASSAGYRGLPHGAPYSAPKAATIHLAEALHLEASEWNIRLRVINPGFVQSKLTAKNDFRMPALLTPAQAAENIVKHLDGDSFEISFPRRLIWPLKLLRCLPYKLYFLLIKKTVLKQ
ncbi:MAG: SDR family NAD(P)-dependent oxidoreductase [bacterium]